jgi:hypothetical protein
MTVNINWVEERNPTKDKLKDSSQNERFLPQREKVAPQRRKVQNMRYRL